MLDATGLTKRYGGVTALAGADLHLSAGEVHALLGENGAGKSTLVKLLAGVTAADAGQVALDGAVLRLSGPADARRHGIAVVFQELSLFPDLDVLGNLFVTAEPTRLGLLDRATMARRARPVLAELGLAGLPLDAPVGRLDLARRQLLEICRALLTDPKLLILDEPTSALPAPAVEQLHDVIRAITARGVAVLYVSHFLDEVTRIADRVTVLRDGLNVPCSRKPSIAEMVTAMIGTDTPASVDRAPAVLGEKTLELRDVTVTGRLEGVSLTARAGEVVGLAGLEGAGHHAVLDLLWGRAVPAAGSIRLPDGGGRPRTTAEAVRRRVAFVPGDRQGLGLMLDATVAANITSVRWLARRDGGFFLNRRAAAALAREHIADLRIRAAPSDRTGALSGGNQQKVVFAKWLAADPSLILLDDPTRGVDVGVRAEMHQIIRRLAVTGRIVLLCSTDPAELSDVCDRAVIFRRGRVTGTLSAPDLTEHTLLHATNAT